MGFKARKPKVRTALLQRYLESEAGWGQRPDGWTLHLDADDHKMFIKLKAQRQHEYFISQGLREGETPREYTRTDGDPKTVIVSEKVYQRLLRAAENCGIRGKGNCPPSIEQLADPDSDILN